MKDVATGLWDRAGKALEVARALLPLDPDAAASRAYYAALYAVSAQFALRGQTFKKHSAVEAAVHRDLVKAGVWTKDLGEKYSFLAELRSVSDYGDLDHVGREDAGDAVQAAGEILRAVCQAHPEKFPEPKQG